MHPAAMQVNKLLQECFATTRLLNCALLPRQVNKLLEDFVVLRGEAWRGATADAPDQGQQLLDQISEIDKIFWDTK